VFLGGRAWVWCLCSGTLLDCLFLDDGWEGWCRVGHDWLARAGVQVALEGGVLVLVRRESLTDVLEDTVKLRVIELLPGKVNILSTAHPTALARDAPGIRALAEPLATFLPILAPLASFVLNESRLGRVAYTVRAADLVLERIKQGFS
jgi:hypothetical protein